MRLHVFERRAERPRAYPPVLEPRVDGVIPEEPAPLGIFAEHDEAHELVPFIDIERSAFALLVLCEYLFDGLLGAELLLLPGKQLDLHLPARDKSEAAAVSSNGPPQIEIHEHEIIVFIAYFEEGGGDAYAAEAEFFIKMYRARVVAPHLEVYYFDPRGLRVFDEACHEQAPHAPVPFAL